MNAPSSLDAAIQNAAYADLPDIDVEEFRKVVLTRRAIRRFQPDDIPPAVLDDCLDLAMLAPNSCNLQPWEFHVVRTPDLRRKLAHACLDQNAARTAPVLIVVVARTNTWNQACNQTLEVWPEEKIPKIVDGFYRRIAKIQYFQGPFSSFGLLKTAFYGAVGLFRPVPRGPYSNAEMKTWAVKSTALAAGTLMLALRAHGYDSCPMEGMDERRVARLLKLPRDATVPMVIAAGKRGERAIYHPRYRFDRRQFIHEH